MAAWSGIRRSVGWVLIAAVVALGLAGQAYMPFSALWVIMTALTIWLLFIWQESNWALLLLFLIEIALLLHYWITGGAL
jgi:hypothetical protein